MLTDNVVIIGITGVGKTTIGRNLAIRLNKEFYDLDKNIANRCGVDIPTIFEIEGETGFRERETDELRKIINNVDQYVLSVGGGSLIQMQNRALIINSSSIVIQLYADLSIVAKRLAKSPNKRPLFYNTDIEAKINELYLARKAYYDEVTTLKINTSLLNPYQVINKIIEFLEINKFKNGSY